MDLEVQHTIMNLQFVELALKLIFAVFSQYNDSQLYTQLCFYQYIFNVQKAQTQLQPSEKGQLFLTFFFTLFQINNVLHF